MTLPTLLVLLLTIPFAGALLLLLLRHRVAVAPQRIALAVTAVAVAVLAGLTWSWSAVTPILFSVPWMPEIGLHFSIWLDGPALFWAWLVIGIGLLVVQYAGHYMELDDAPWRFYSILLAFMGSMLGVVISDNLLLMFVFWEMTSLTSFLLIGHWHESPSARQGAKRALLITALGGLSLMCGAAVVGMIVKQLTGSIALDWETLWQLAPQIADHRLAPAALVLLLIGAFTKSAQFPFHVWLPGAMEAPTPVSAYLHAATMVKAGIYLLGRLYPIFHSMELWFYLVAFVGVATMLVGGWMACRSFDLKLLLAWSTVSQLGLITAFYGFGFGEIGDGEKLLKLDLLLVASHALFKAGLFMIVGILDSAAGTRDWRSMGGLMRKLPVTGALTIIGCASMAGAPLTFGFVAKKMFLEAALHMHAPLSWMMILLYSTAVAASALTVAYCLRMVVLPYFGPARDKELYKHAHEVSPGFLFSPALLCGACLLAGLYVPLLEVPIAHLVNADYYGTHSHYAFAFFHFNQIDLNFWSSIVLLVLLGPAIFIGIRKLDQAGVALHKTPWLRDFWDHLLDIHLIRFASALSRIMQSPSLRRNATVILLFLIGMVGIPLAGETLPIAPRLFSEHGTIAAIGIVLFTLVLVIMVAAEWQPLHRLLALGFVGMLVAGIFVAFKGPDLAITQMLVELVILLMFLLLLPRLHAPKKFTAPAFERAVTLCISIAAGTLIATLTYFAILSDERLQPAVPNRPTHSEFYLANSKEPADIGEHSGGGNNVVNVILVDFRGMDTLGEITVLLIAALGVGVMTRLTRTKQRSLQPPEEDEVSIFTSEGYQKLKKTLPLKIRPAAGGSLVLRELAPIVTVLALNFAVVLLLTGHNAPGGGFIAALMTSAALVPYFLAFRRGEPRRPALAKPICLMPIGLFLAAGTGLVPIIFGHAFLHSTHTSFHLPLLGELEFASAMMFDLGVYVLVLGITLFILKHFGKA